MNLLQLQKQLPGKSLADIIYRAYELGLEDNPFEAARKALVLTTNKEEKLELLDLMENWLLSDEEEGYLDSPEVLRAGEVMNMLGITRPTLCHYVKLGYIRVRENLTTKSKKSYLYYKEDVLNLLATGKKKQSWKKEA